MLNPKKYDNYFRNLQSFVQQHYNDEIVRMHTQNKVDRTDEMIEFEKEYRKNIQEMLIKYKIPHDFLGVQPFRERITDLCTGKFAYGTYRKNRTEIIEDKKAYQKKRKSYHRQYLNGETELDLKPVKQVFQVESEEGGPVETETVWIKPNTAHF